ncbi:hypothetical protein ACHAXA_006679 [Cyclostephanos tholiformis]|uniref:GPR180/TMEM145 transmembrane domain-containing protein n=1 Tax=Cyclostephanos tholiformis TaxID=382380 RepID=A0ABD3R7H7_9STRA
MDTTHHSARGRGRRRFRLTMGGCSRASSSSSSLHLAAAMPLPLLLLLFLVLCTGVTLAKVQSGRVHLSGVRTESTLVKFAVPSSSKVELDVNITSYGMYVNERDLRLRVYVDDEWPTVRREPLCREKVKYAFQSLPVVLDYSGRVPDDRGGTKRGTVVEMYKARVVASMYNPPPPKPGGGRPPSPRMDRPRYYYFVIDDCSLEESYGDDKVPDMYYSASVRSARRSTSSSGGGADEGLLPYDHLPADEDGIRPLLLMTLAFSGMLFALLFLNMARTTSMAVGGGEERSTWRSLSSWRPTAHMEAYRRNGYGNYSFDALSSHFEALSDSMVSLILLSIGGGWTLPTDNMGGGGGGLLVGRDNDSKLMRGIRNPAGSLLDLISNGGGNGDGRGGIVAIAIILLHAILAQWGRTFDDDFDTYHALEHPPGKALMILRFVLGLVFVTGVGMVRSGSQGRCPPSLMSFLTKFGLVGLSYYSSLPGISMFVGSALPYHRRHQALHWGAALVQASSLASLTWLFVGGSDASAYHRLSRVGKRRGVDGADMAEAISSSQRQQSDNIGRGGTAGGRPTMWHFGKTKIRLD